MKNLMSIECQICNQIFSGMKGFAAHIRSHEINYYDYVKKYVNHVPNYERCEICDKVTKVRGNSFVTCSNQCKNEWKSQNWRGKNHPMYGRSHTKETKRKISEKAKDRLKDPQNHHMYGKSHSDETKRKISNSHKKLYENGYVNPMKGNTHSKNTIKKIFSSWEDSSAEKCVMNVLNSHEINYTHQFFLQTDDGDTKSYDFYIPKYNTLLEVDGDYWHGGPKYNKHFKGVKKVKENDRLKDNLAKESGYNIVRVWESEIEKKKDIVVEKIKLDY